MYRIAVSARWFACLDGVIVGLDHQIAPRYLNRTGAAAWCALAEHDLTLDQLVDHLASAVATALETDATVRPRVARETATLMSQLIQLGLVVDAG